MKLKDFLSRANIESPYSIPDANYKLELLNLLLEKNYNIKRRVESHPNISIPSTLQLVYDQEMNFFDSTVIIYLRHLRVILVLTPKFSVSSLTSLHLKRKSHSDDNYSLPWPPFLT